MNFHQTLSISQNIEIEVDSSALRGFWQIPQDARGVVVFAHGSGSSRMSPRNQFVAECLNEDGFGTLLFDLLTPPENEIDERTRHLRFDIERLTGRLIRGIDWVAQQESVENLPVGLFGASTGASAALKAAARRPDRVEAVVSRGGRPDLAGDELEQVRAPSLLVVGGNDRPVIQLNHDAARKLNCEHRIEIVSGASHLFEESGKLEEVARLAADWFIDHLKESPENSQ